MIKDCLLQVHPSQMAQISSATAKPVTISKVYKDFENVFSTEKADHLPLYKDHDHAIDLVDDK